MQCYKVNIFQSKKILTILFFIFSIALYARIEVEIPEVSDETYHDFLIPVNMIGLATEEIYSIFSQIDFDNEQLTILGVINDGTVTEDWADPIYNLTDQNSLQLSFYSTEILPSDGTLFYISARVEADFDLASSAEISSFVCNEGEPQAALSAGSISVVHRIPAFLPADDIEIMEGGLIEFDIVATDPFNQELFFEAEDLPAAAIFSDNSDGTASVSWQTEANDQGNYQLNFMVENLDGYSSEMAINILVRNQLNVWLPDLASLETESISIPLMTDNLDDLGIYSFYTRFSFDPAVVYPSGITTAGTICENWGSINWNVSAENEIIISGFDTDEISGSGELLNIEFDIVGSLGDRSDFIFDYFQYNEGNPVASVTDGILFLGEANPYFTAQDNVSLNESEVFSLQIVGHDPLDKDFSINPTELAEEIQYTDNGDGTLDLYWQTDFFDAGIYPVEFIIENSDQLTNTLSFEIIVGNVPQPPYVQQSLEDFSFDEDTVHNEVDLNNVFSDPDLNFGDQLDFSFSGNDKIMVEILDGLVVLEPEADWNGIENISFTATDLAMNAVTESVEIQVINVNDQPYIKNPLTDFSIDEDSSDSSIDLNHTFEDIDGDPLAFSVAGNDHIAVEINAGIVTMIPEANWVGAELLTFIADDGQTARESRISNSEQVLVTVNPINDAPVIISTIPDIVMDNNGNFVTATLDEFFMDIDSELSFFVENNSAISWVLNSDNSITLTPAENWFGMERLIFVAEDEFGAEISQLVDVTVLETFTISEDFDHNGNLPEDWSVEHFGTTSNPWAIQSDLGSDFSVRTANSFSDNSNEILISELYNLSGISDINVSFFSDILLEEGDEAYFQYSSDGFTWNDIAYFTSSESGTKNFSIPSNQGQYIVKFRWIFSVSNVFHHSSQWTIDDLVIGGIIDDTTSPTTVTDLSIDTVMENTVKLTWTPVEEEYFAYYEVFYSTDQNVTSEDFLWSVEQDNMLQFVQTDFTIISDLQIDTHYWFKIRGVDTSGNVGELSNSSSLLLANPLVIQDVVPSQEMGVYHNSRDVTLGATFIDDILVDASSLQCRIDANGNGSYSDDTWVDILSYSDASTIVVEYEASFNVDGEALHFEFRGEDKIGSGYVYSGSENISGIADDYYVMIDSQAPAIVQNLRVDTVTDDSIALVWDSIENEPHFAGYQIRYDTTDDFDENSLIWDLSSDSSLGTILADATTISGLDLEQVWYFQINSSDTYGNFSAFSDVVISVENSEKPICSDLYPDNIFVGSYIVELGATFYDAYGIALSTIQVRIDADGDGSYANDEWVNVYPETRWDPEHDIVQVLTEVQFGVEMMNLHYEFRASDIDGYGPTYSGSQSLEGISDDAKIHIDVTSPEDIPFYGTFSSTDNSAVIGWGSSADDNFAEYQVYYAEHENVTENDFLWDSSNDPQLALADPLGSNYLLTEITGLQPSTLYYYRVRATDFAGNYSNFTEVGEFTTRSNFAPKAPTNLQIEIVGNDVYIAWDEVTENVNDEPIDVAQYNVYFGNRPEISTGANASKITTTENSVIHQNAALIQKIFYKVTATEASRSDSKDIETFISSISKQE